jgi:hypothetical protein
MCIAIAKPEGIELTEDVLRNSHSSNRDGAGFAYIEPAGVAPHFLEKPEVCIEKGYFDYDHFREAFEPHKLKRCLIHFRVATHKNVDGKNCHPWRVNDDLVFIHNGTIGFLPTGGDDNLSDTGNFNGQIVQPSIGDFPRFYMTRQFKWLVENSIAGHNKLVFMDRDGNFVFIHEDKGKWDQGVWFSNDSYRSYLAGFKTVVGQPDPPQPAVTTYKPSESFNRQAAAHINEKKDGNTAPTADLKDIDGDDAVTASELEAELGKDIVYYDNVADLDQALEEANRPKVVA